MKGWSESLSPLPAFLCALRGQANGCPRLERNVDFPQPGSPRSSAVTGISPYAPACVLAIAVHSVIAQFCEIWLFDLENLDQEDGQLVTKFPLLIWNLGRLLSFPALDLIVRAWNMASCIVSFVRTRVLHNARFSAVLTLLSQIENPYIRYE